MQITKELLRRIDAANKAIAVARGVDAKAGKIIERDLAVFLGFSHPDAGIPDIRALVSNGLELGAGEVTLTSERPFGKFHQKKNKNYQINKWARQQRRTTGVE